MPDQLAPPTVPTSAPPVAEGALIPGAERFCRGVVSVSMLAGLVIGLGNLAMWLGEPLRTLLLYPGSMVMRLNTAVSITAAATSLGLWQLAAKHKKGAILATFFGALTALIGLLTTVETLFHCDLHIDTLLGPATFSGDIAAPLVKQPGRMSLNASASLAFLGLGLVLLDRRRLRADGRVFHPAPALLLLGSLPAVCGLIGYLLNTGQFTGLLRSTTILFHTALAIFLLCLGALAVRPQRPPVRRILSLSADGTLLRWMLPGFTVLLIGLACLITMARSAGWVAPGEGTALMLYGGLILLSILIVAAGKAVARQAASARVADTARREEENRSRAIVDSALDAVVIMDAKGLVLDWNPAAERMFGWKREEILGRSLADHIIPPALRAAHHLGLLRYLEFGDSRVLGRRMELPSLRRDGTEFPAELSINILSAGERSVFVGFVRDITQRRQAEESLRESEHRFRALADNISQFAWITDETGKVLWFNRRWYDYTGVRADDVVTARRQKVLHPDHARRVREKFLDCLKRGTPWEDVFPLLGADGHYRWFLSRANPIYDQQGKVLRWFGTNTDVTQQRELSDELARAKESAEDANRAKDHFLAALSHELRTPLTPALMTAAALRHDVRLPEEVRADLAMIERSIGLESRLIDDLLDLTRLARGKLPLRSIRCDLHSLLGHAIDIVRDEAQTKRITLELQLRASRFGLTGDSARVQQVFWNLLKNAVKFTPEGGRVQVRTRDREGHFCLEVSDTGIGFATDSSERLFQPFEQADREHSHRFGGLGLGLAIARAVVDLHGGTIRAHSEGPSRGATFTVEFPGAAEPPPGLTREHNGYGEKVTLSRSLRILLVEDHEPTLAVLSRLLARSGHTVLAANNIASAMATAASHSFDAVVSDLGLPDGTGQQLMTQLRIDRPKLRGIALSGYGMEEDQMRSREAGFVRHLVKPIEFEQLTRALQEIFPP